MNSSPFERRKKAKFAFAILSFALVVCALVALILVYMAQARPRF